MSRTQNKPPSMVSRRIFNANERQNVMNDDARQESSTDGLDQSMSHGGAGEISELAVGYMPHAAIMSNNNNMSSKSQRVKQVNRSEAVGQQQPPGTFGQDNNESGGAGGFSAATGTGDSTVVHKDRNGTITVQSTKTVGKSNYSFVSVSPTKKTIVDSQQMKHIQVIQQNEIRSWTGMQVQFMQRPGIGNIHTNRKFEKMSEYFKFEDDRFKNFLELVNRVRDNEEEKLAYSGMSQPLQDKMQATPASIVGQVGPPAQRIQEFVNFKMPKDIALINRDNINMLCFTKPSQYEQSQFDMFFKMVKADARLVKAVLETNGMNQTEGNEWNIQWTSQSVKSYVYEQMSEYQKINHFPMSYELTRKDRLCENVVKMQERFGKETFNILPDSYILPDEFADFYSHFHSLRSKEATNMWIIKPQNSSQGKGIYIIDDISEVPIDEQCIISRYVSNPFLINGLKFDLRLYVCITSMDPWRIYIYNEGLVRFASEPYDASLGKGAKYSHLTNFSINKKNERYVNNANADLDDSGHKWSLNALTRHLEQAGIDMDLLWSRIYDVVLKSLICIDGHVQTQLKKMTHKSNCFELLGYDVLIDQDLKPWLMEVNLSPSLATESPLDLKIKSQLFVDTMNLVSMRKFDRRRENITKMKNRFKNIMRAKSYQSRQNYPNSAAATKHGVLGDDKNRRRDPEDWIGDHKKLQAIEKISALNNRFRDFLRDTLIENQRKNNFIRIYPARHSDIYDQYFVQQRPLHKFLYKALFSDEFIPFQTKYPMIPALKGVRGGANGDQHENEQQQIALQQAMHVGVGIASSNFSRSVTSGRIEGNGVNQTERIGGPGSPSKKYGESGTHSLSLHPIIPEEPAESVGSTAKKNRAAFRDDDDQSIGQPYGAARDSGVIGGATESERNNSTAKSQKRQQHDLQRRTTNKFVKGINGSTQSNSRSDDSKEAGHMQDNYSKQKSNVPNSTPAQQPSGQSSQKTSTTDATGKTVSNIAGASSQSQKSTDSRRQGAVLSSTADLQSVSASSTGGNREKLLITGDDVLIEYVHRLMIAVQSIKEVMLKPTWKHQIEKFIKHYVWHTSDVRRAANNKLWQRLESRLIEMKERRKRLLQNIYLREKNMDHTNLPKINPNSENSATEQDYSYEFQKEYETKEAQKNVIIQGFSASQLEEMLRTSTRNVAYEVISCLIDQNGRGVLTEIIKFLTISNKHIIEVEENCSSILDNLNKKSHSHYGRHHNYLQNSKYGNIVPRIDESVEDCEGYANINVNLAVPNPKKAYQASGNSSSGMGMSSGTAPNSAIGVNNSTLGSSSTTGQAQAGSNNDIRIKIRKNSIEPHLIAKANHKQIMRQRILKEQQQRQMMQISSNAVIPNSSQGSKNTSQIEPGSFQNVGEDLKGEVDTSEKNLITPRTISQRQASRSFKLQSDGQEQQYAADGGVAANNAAGGLEDSQFSIEDLQQDTNGKDEQDRHTKTGSFIAKTNTNNLFDKSVSRDKLAGNNGKDGPQEVSSATTTDDKLDRGLLLHSQVSKTARYADSSSVIVDGKIPKVAVTKHLNRDLIASSENLNDFSPKSNIGGSRTLGTTGQLANQHNQHQSSQYLAKLSQDAGGSGTVSSDMPLEQSLKDVKIRNAEPRGRLGNFKKSSNGNSTTTGGGANDEQRIRRTELSGQIPSTTSVQSFSKQLPPSTMTNNSSTSAAAADSAYLTRGLGTELASSSAATEDRKQPPSPSKSLRESRVQIGGAQSPTPVCVLTSSSFIGNRVGSGQPQIELMAATKPGGAVTEKKEHGKRSGGHVAKNGKGHMKVVKRNLIQSGELAQRDLVNSGGDAGTSETSNHPKRSANARGSSSKGAGGAKGNGNRQHKF